MLDERNIVVSEELEEQLDIIKDTLVYLYNNDGLTETGKQLLLEVLVSDELTDLEYEVTGYVDEDEDDEEESDGNESDDEIEVTDGTTVVKTTVADYHDLLHGKE